MRQFGLYQDIPPPVPRCIDEETHKMSNMGRSGVDWNAENIEWINQWNNEALQNIVPQQRTYDATTTEAYYNWGVAYLLQFVLRNHERSLMLMKKERKRSRGVLRQSAGMGGVRQEQDGVP
ncbi:hypothetical protein D1007_40181 [Hordeum vulgare]|nr:hypothetical protein D1007_40181 [Hordeum vulgare]